MLLPRLLALSAALAAASATPAGPDDRAVQAEGPSYLSAREVAELKAAQKHRPGYFHQNVTLGTGADALVVPVIEGDYDVLLDGEKGVRARALAPRGACAKFSKLWGSCSVNYCWKDGSGVAQSAYITVKGATGKKGSGIPDSVYSSNTKVLNLDRYGNDGYNGWFARRHECHDGDTQMFTAHLIQGTVVGRAMVDKFRCDICDFDRLRCYSSFLANNLVALGSDSTAYCRSPEALN
ncbi:uncharacterized protein UV8b_00033 [Ustilaginoidea virens]|uniref:Uncharacterized protein n=1 Tax=Ustilaginoidea virens TaxID=1159556 RepID=A0A063BTU6_USTVR|nr:uncharacterized protein UV8b_00033 [Ustilaginoidea virens]QUC15792.1 hypothetical protein UV8b_00033 [Ustilaginoidea virens]GAO18706.1 hypothetical protein UVI_02053120 [Ustilaginoidea virens]